MKNYLFCGLFALFAGVAAAGTISILPATQTVNSGQSVSVSVNAANVSDLFAFSLDLAFNPSVLSATAITEGAFLPSGGTTAFLPGTIDNVGGTIDFNADSLIGAISGVTGNGTLLTIQFTALNGGTSAINLANVSLLNSTFSPIAATSTNGSVTVQGTAATPEPGTLVLLGAGLCGMLLRRRQFASTHNG